MKEQAPVPETSETFGLSEWVWNILVADEEQRPAVAEVVATIEKDHRKPKRHYHTFDGHVLFMTGFLERHKRLLKNPRVPLWAALNHDRVYDPRARAEQNERKSAQRARKDLRPLLPEEEVDMVVRYIQVTANHLTDDIEDPDLALFIDADLAILGAAPEVYDAYSAAIRREYAHVADEHFREGRAEMLQKFLTRESIFNTYTVYTEYEQQARENMRRELTALGYPLEDIS